MGKIIPSDFFGISGSSSWNFVARIQIETIALLTRRAQAYMTMAHALEVCHDPEELMTEQVRFWQIAQRDYLSSLGVVISATSPKHDTVSQQTIVPAARVRDYIVMTDPSKSAVEPPGPLPVAAYPSTRISSRDLQVRVRKFA